MEKYAVSVGQSRTTKKWKQVEYTIDELYDLLLLPKRTPETVSEYKRMRKDRRDAAKDVGGFVGGALEEGLRRADKVQFRSMLTLDMDAATSEFVESVYLFCAYRAIIYSTHSHTPESPRLRLIVPLKRNITPDEYEAVARYVAADWGADMFDPCSFRAHQLMYWPSCPIDGEYICLNLEGDVLDPDTVLARHPNWRDLSEVENTQTPQATQQADPLLKPGVIGAFCRTYSITAAMAVFLGGIYAPTTKENRFDYVPADSSAGVIVYDDKFAYSHHATDPAGGQLLNAFDLVRVHKFPGNDDSSIQQMVDFAIHLPEVKHRIAVERTTEAVSDFSGEAGGTPTDDVWMSSFEVDKRGVIKDEYGNYVLIMRNDNNLRGLGYNLLSSSIEKRSSTPWESNSTGWTDNDFAQLQTYISEKYGLFSEKKLRTALTAVAAERQFHPIRTYLESLPEWDGIDRVDTLLVDYLGAEDTKFNREAIRKTLLAAVTRIYHPGTKFDTALILNGPQGIGKSTFFAKLAGDWFSDSLVLTDMRDKTGAENLQGNWMVEISELAGMRKAEVESVKAFLSRVDDRYRPAFGRYTESHPRQCVIVGSTNAQDGFLRDTTGNRRFWVVKVESGSQLKPWDLNKGDIDQIWAEVLTIYAAKTDTLQLSREAVEQAIEVQESVMETDERTEIVAEYLDMVLPRDWYSKSVADRRRYFRERDELTPVNGGAVRERVTILEVWCECFDRDAATISRVDSLAIAGILRSLGWDLTGTVYEVKGYGKKAKFFKRPQA